MDIADSYLILTLLLTLAAILAWTSKRLGFSYVVGYIAAGVALSYIMPTIVEEEVPLLTIFSDVAIALLAFEVGREVGFENIKKIGVVPALIGLGEVVVSFTVATVLGLVLRFSWNDIAILALISLSTSTAVTYRLMEERGFRGDMGKLILTVSTVEDIIQIIALALLPQVAHGHVDFFKAIESIIFSTIIAALLILAGVTIVKRIFAKIIGPDEFGLTLSVCLSFAYALISRRAGLSPALGAFAAGLALSAHPQANEISERIRPLKELFLVIFFVAMGLNANIASIPTPQLSIALALSLPVVITKFVAFSVSTWLVSGYGFEDVARMTFFAITISEFGLIVAYEATRLGLTSQPMIMISAVSTILAMIISSTLTRNPDRGVTILSRLMPIPVRLPIDNASKYLNKIFEKRVSRVLHETFMKVMKEGALMVLIAFIASSMLYVIDSFLEPPYSFASSMMVMAIAVASIVVIAYRVYIHADELCYKFLCEQRNLNPIVRRFMRSLLFIGLLSLVVLVATVTSSQYVFFLISRIVGPDQSYAVTALIIVGILATIFSIILIKLRNFVSSFRGDRT
ncbi:MAG: cation:proton antiporter [Candidatus Nezhaarchaeales archaeon]